MTQTVVILVTHLLGTGHLARALTLGGAFSAAGWQAHVMSGGFPAPHLDQGSVRLHQLPPLRSDGTDFTTLLGPEGTPADAAYRAARGTAACQIIQEVKPDIFITELFPFGRRNLKAEFEAACDTARQTGARVFASIRDILAPPSKPKKVDYALDMIQRFFDGVLVHSDPNAIDLSRSWPVSETLARKLDYTGFVTSAMPPLSQAKIGHGEILVSTGGGGVGRSLFETCLDAARNSDDPWRLLIGGQDARARAFIAQLEPSAPPNVILEPVRPDFREILQRARAFIGFCGYNTAMDVLQAGLPSVLIPFEEGNEVEQSLRADALRDLPGIEVVRLQGLRAEDLSAALHAVCNAPSRDRSGMRFNGASRTVQICAEALT